MEEKKIEKMNIRRAIRSLNLGESLLLQREDIRPSYLRTLCSKLKDDEGMYFSVHKSDKGYTVTRYE